MKSSDRKKPIARRSYQAKYRHLIERSVKNRRRNIGENISIKASMAQSGHQSGIINQAISKQSASAAMSWHQWAKMAINHQRNGNISGSESKAAYQHGGEEAWRKAAANDRNRRR